MVWSLQTPDALTEQEFGQWRTLLEQRTGISLTEQKQPFLQTQITMRMRELGFNSYAEYFRKVNDGLWGKAEWSVLVDRLMIKETSFFRHSHSMECVQRFLQNRINNQQISGSFDVWSVGCSTGEEPYSLAMILNDCYELARLNPYYGIFATDISLPALSTARAGVYSSRKIQGLNEHHQRRYFEELGNGRFKILDKLQERLCFSQANLIELNTMPIEKMDVIYCQNVLIYFHRWRREEILQKFIEHLKPGGLLVIGLGEMSEWKPQHLQRVADERVQAYVRCD